MRQPDRDTSHWLIIAPDSTPIVMIKLDITGVVVVVMFRKAWQQQFRTFSMVAPSGIPSQLN